MVKPTDALTQLSRNPSDPSRVAHLHLLEAFGIEIEYMIVDRDSLNVRPIADQVLKAVAGDYVQEIELGDIAWSNELTLHLLELKTNGPSPVLPGLAGKFQNNITRINEVLALQNACLMPTAMHPWMDPLKEKILWPHHDHEIYRAFDEIFDCRGHGWANLQSVHINLPFAGDDEFGRLHAAIRLILPILPALAASSPLVDGKLSGNLDTRLNMYQNNSRNIPSVSGRIIPEPVYNKHDYDKQIYARIIQDLLPYGHNDVLNPIWVNSRGAIARFDRGSIEIRLLDTQENAFADLGIVAVITNTIRGLLEEKYCTYAQQQVWSVEDLYAILQDAIINADYTTIRNANYLKMFGFDGSQCSAQDLWISLIDQTRSAFGDSAREWEPAWQTYCQQGTLARRIQAALRNDVSHAQQKRIYQKLCYCLASGTSFV